jgi:hypothetical protein
MGQGTENYCLMDTASVVKMKKFCNNFNLHFRIIALCLPPKTLKGWRYKALGRQEEWGLSSSKYFAEW